MLLFNEPDKRHNNKPLIVGSYHGLSIFKNLGPTLNNQLTNSTIKAAITIDDELVNH